MYSSLIILVPALILLGLGSIVLANNTITYFSYLKELEKDNLDPHYCNGVRCFCNNLQCISKDEREKEFLDSNLIGAAFVLPAGVLIFLFSKRKYLKARNIL